MKLILGAAIGVAIARIMVRIDEQDAIPAEEREPITDQVKSMPARLRDRWERARAAGDAAAEVEKARLTAAFRDKVDDPYALTPPNPPSS